MRCLTLAAELRTLRTFARREIWEVGGRASQVTCHRDLQTARPGLPLPWTLSERFITQLKYMHMLQSLYLVHCPSSPKELQISQCQISLLFNCDLAFGMTTTWVVMGLDCAAFFLQS